MIVYIQKGTVMSHVNILKQHSLKATLQRLCVLEVLENYGHATLEDIEKQTKIKFPTLSLSTIYRNINEMLKKEILSEVKLSNKKEYYEITKDNHAHLVCSSCGKIEDFTLNIGKIIKNVQPSTRNKIYNATISFDTICKECLSAK